MERDINDYLINPLATGLDNIIAIVIISHVVGAIHIFCSGCKFHVLILGRRQIKGKSEDSENNLHLGINWFIDRGFDNKRFVWCLGGYWHDLHSGCRHGGEALRYPCSTTSESGPQSDCFLQSDSKELGMSVPRPWNYSNLRGNRNPVRIQRGILSEHLYLELELKKETVRYSFPLCCIINIVILFYTVTCRTTW